MKIIKLLFFLPLFLTDVAYGVDGCEYDNVVAELRQNCTGINLELQNIKKYEDKNKYACDSPVQR